ncbi:MAG TPA: hypothetical protein VMZ27_04135 [Candidatus Saccharimonadales bacterium]|nr:hypothetical protein [Candidatus Saccharimonadales bacterium]
MNFRRSSSQYQWRKTRSASPHGQQTPGGTFGKDKSTLMARGFAQLIQALKESTRCRARLSLLLPDIFGAAACCPDKHLDGLQRWKEEVHKACTKVFREIQGEAEDEPSDQPPPKLLHGQSRLDCKEFHSLSEEKKAVVQDEYEAWQTWEQVLQKHNETWEKENPKWKESPSPACAHLRHLWSLYRQSLLGLSSTSSKEGMLRNASEKEDGETYEQICSEVTANAIKIWGHPPSGVSVLEHAVRCSVLASAGLDWKVWPPKPNGLPSDSENHSIGSVVPDSIKES